MRNGIKDILYSYNGKKSELILILQDIQSMKGYLSADAMYEVSNFLGIPESEVYGVATFYTQFRLNSAGKKHIMVCKGTACHVSGAPQIIEGIERYLDIKDGETTDDLEYSLESVGCLGCCALAPCAMINDEIKSNISIKDIKNIFSKVQDNNPNNKKIKGK